MTRPPLGAPVPPKGTKAQIVTRFPDREADGIAGRFLDTYGTVPGHVREEAQFVLAGILVLYRARPRPKPRRRKS